MKKHLSPALAVLGVTVLLGVAQAQAQTTTAMPGKMMMTSDTDKQFMTELAQGSAYDEATAQLAVQKAQSKSVQRYALKLMDDHTRLNKELFIQANKRGATLPLTLSDDDKTKLMGMMNMSGSDFDMAYLQEAVRINAEDVKDGNDAINASQDQEFRRLIRDYVNTEQKHLNEASALLAGLQRSMGTMNNGMMNGTMMPGGTMNNGAMMNSTTMAPATGTTMMPATGTMPAPDTMAPTTGTMPPVTP